MVDVTIILLADPSSFDVWNPVSKNEVSLEQRNTGLLPRALSFFNTAFDTILFYIRNDKLHVSERTLKHIMLLSTHSI